MLLVWQGPLPLENRLLLDIYSQVPEPDGIYAAARSPKLVSQMHLFWHEGSWSKALLGSDLMFRCLQSQVICIPHAWLSTMALSQLAIEVSCFM